MLKQILKNIPNALTIVRFILIPYIIMLLLQHDYVGAIIMLTVSGITDILDGFIARKFNFISDFGKLMDPLADKATQVAILITLTIQHIVPLWIIVIVLLKEILMIAGASFLYGKELVVSSKWYGKLATVLFYTAIVCSLFIRYWNTVLTSKFNLNSLILFDKYIYYFAIISTLFSFGMYVKAFYVQGYLKKTKNK